MESKVTSYKPRSNHKQRPQQYAHDIKPASGDLWEHVRNNFTLPDYTDFPQVQAQIAWYVRHQDHLTRVANRASPYMYYIFDQTKQHNLPAEIVLLPTIESAFNPFAKSYAGASGLWQMMPYTASKFGIKRNYWYDGRRDVLSSTKGAMDYLNYLCEFFNHDWLLALAAYDSGEGTVLNAIQRNIHEGRGTDFWSLHLPAETRAYVPRLLAVAAIIKEPERYGVTLPYIKDAPYLGCVTIKKPIKISTAAKMTGISAEHLNALNPGCSRSTVHPHGNDQLVLPLDKIELFQQQYLSYHEPAFMETSSTRHIVHSGETISSIAHRYHTSIKKIRNVNHLHRDSLRIGQVLTIPGKTPVAADLDIPEHTLAISHKRKHSKETGLTHYTIKVGDTPWRIAQHFHVDPNKLMTWNNLKRTKPLHPGQQLTIYR